MMPLYQDTNFDIFFTPVCLIPAPLYYCVKPYNFKCPETKHN